MAVHAQFGGGLPFYSNNTVAEEQVWALRDYGALLYATTGKDVYDPCAAGVVISAAQSDLTCNGGGKGRKRGRDLELDQFVSSSSAALLPIPGMQQAEEAFVAQPSSAAAANRMAGSAMASTSARAAAEYSVADALLSELYRQGAEVDALVRAGMERARKRQCLELVRAVAGAGERRMREKEAEVDAARRRNAELEERVRRAAAESQAWLGAARANEAVAAGLRATLDHVLIMRSSAGAGEGFGDSDPAAEVDDAQSCCFEAKASASANATSAVAKRACRACGGGEASVLLLPCRHLCLCKSCEPRLDACPVCLAAKNASIHVAPN